MNDKNRMTQTGEFWMVFAALAYAAGNIFDKLAMSQVFTDSFCGGFVKEFPQMLLPLIFIIFGIDKKQFGKSSAPKRTFKENVSVYKWFILCGIVSELIASVLFLQAMKFGGVNVAVPTVQTWTLMGAVMGIIFLKEKFHRNIVIGAAIAVAGLCILSIGQFVGMPVSPQWFLGVIFALITALCWALSTLFFTKGQKAGAGRSIGMFLQYFSGAIFLLIFILCTDRVSLFTTIPGHFYGALLIAASFSAFAMIFLYTAVRLGRMSKILPINTSYPALTAIIAWLFLGESMNVYIAAGIVMVIIGVTISQRTRAKISEAEMAHLAEEDKTA